MSSTRNALVIGGGIAGPTAAMALQKAGVEAVVYEAYPTAADRVGAFLTLASNGVDALGAIAADQPVVAAGFPTPWITMRSGTGKRLGESPLGNTLPDGTASHTMRRADLCRALHDQAISRGVRIEFDRRLVAAEDTGDGVRATFADGSVATGDVLIGCDGVRSTVRAIIDPRAPAPKYAGLLGTGGYASGVRMDTAPGTYEMIFGKRAFSATRWRPTVRSGGSPTCRVATALKDSSVSAVRSCGTACSTSPARMPAPPSSSYTPPLRSCR